MRALALAPVLALLACAPAASGGSAVAPASTPRAQARPDVVDPGREPARRGPPPPRYRPSSGSPAPIPITSDAYGAYAAAESAPHLRDTLADFEVPLADGGTFTLKQARAAGPVVVMFYRGFW